MSSARRIMEMLEGTWQLQRSVSGSHQARVSGRAVFLETQVAGELLYREEVEMQMPNQPTIQGHRAYRYRLGEDGTSINIYFNDAHERAETPRLYQRLRMPHPELNENITVSAEHYCAPDTYKTTYEFGQGFFRTELKVTGPQKNYMASTQYTRSIRNACI